MSLRIRLGVILFTVIGGLGLRPPATENPPPPAPPGIEQPIGFGLDGP